MKKDLLSNIDKIHTTELGLKRIVNNLCFVDRDHVEFCKKIIADPNTIIMRNGKNFYCTNDSIQITVNASTYTIITAHKTK